MSVLKACMPVSQPLCCWQGSTRVAGARAQQLALDPALHRYDVPHTHALTLKSSQCRWRKCTRTHTRSVRNSRSSQPSQRSNTCVCAEPLTFAFSCPPSPTPRNTHLPFLPGGGGAGSPGALCGCRSPTHFLRQHWRHWWQLHQPAGLRQGQDPVPGWSPTKRCVAWVW